MWAGGDKNDRGSPALGRNPLVVKRENFQYFRWTGGNQAATAKKKSPRPPHVQGNFSRRKKEGTEKPDGEGKEKEVLLH